jgi:hypothetical protein
MVIQRRPRWPRARCSRANPTFCGDRGSRNWSDRASRPILVGGRPTVRKRARIPLSPPDPHDHLVLLRYPEPIHVTHDQQWRIFQRQGILLELGERGVEVLPLTLIFPAEVIALPYVGPTLATRGLGRTAFKCVPLARGVGICRGGLVQHSAKIDEMGLRRRPFFQFGGFPLSDEFIWCQFGWPREPDSAYRSSCINTETAKQVNPSKRFHTAQRLFPRWVVTVWSELRSCVNRQIEATSVCNVGLSDHQGRKRTCHLSRANLNFSATRSNRLGSNSLPPILTRSVFLPSNRSILVERPQPQSA